MRQVALLQPPVREWFCPNCPTIEQTKETRPHTRFHPCAGLSGLSAPMIEIGTKAKVEVHEREDYIGSEQVQLHEGRPIMSVVTTREDGQDVTVYAPRAAGTGRST